MLLNIEFRGSNDRNAPRPVRTPVNSAEKESEIERRRREIAHLKEARDKQARLEVRLYLK